MYASYNKFFELYDSSISPQEFNRLSWEADRIIHRQTTGADNVRKLEVAFPTDEYSAECVRRCECELVEMLYTIEQAQAAQGFVTREDGTVTRRAIASVSSGSESISYAQTAGTDAVSAALASPAQRDALLRAVVVEHLSGITDANGVNLLYMGRYPYVP